ncbi:MAG: hypothetical protein V5A37_04945 [Halobacteriales archaeon]
MAATAVGVGLFGGAAVLVAVALWASDVRFASRKTFAFGALLLGFGLLGWSGSIMAGSGVEAMQRHLDVGGGWTERKSRRAMIRIGSFGAGWMVGSAVATAVLG